MGTVNFSTRIGTPTNLATGGTYDLLLLSFPAGFPEGQIKFAIDDTPRKVTGIQKVGQTFLKTLFTNKGSDVIYPDRGTNFQSMTINANVTEDDNLFVSDLAQEIRNAEGQTKYLLNTMNADAASQLKEVAILSLDTSAESVTLYLRIVTVAGERAAIAVPFPQLDMVINEDTAP